MVVMDNGVIKGVKGIDNDLAFGKGYDQKMLEDMQTRGYKTITGKLPQDLSEIDHTFAQAIIDAAKDEKKKQQIEEALTSLLSEDEIKATIHRLGALANFLKPLMKRKDGPVVTLWK
jgi:hypothetical protein